MTTILSYGGGRQTVALCVMIEKEVLPRPDLAIMADTGRENPMTWAYLAAHVKPLLDRLKIPLVIAPHSLATVDLHGKNGDLLLPMFTAGGGKLRGFCSNEWKRRVRDRMLRGMGITGGERWLGLAFDERKRWKNVHDTQEGPWRTVCPLVDKMINTDACLSIIESRGWPLPHQSSCWMCPHKRNREWRVIRDEHPELFEAACDMEDRLREDDEQGGVFFHRSLVPLREADLSGEESAEVVRQCSLGMCFV